MKKLVVVTAVISGLLLILAPRFILPACEYEGYPAMHCSDTARAEYIAGALLTAIGIGTIFFKSARTVFASAAASFVLYAVAFWLPDKFGYCQSARMPCNYGMVPGIRFIATASALCMLIAMIGVAVKSLKKGNA